MARSKATGGNKAPKLPKNIPKWLPWVLNLVMTSRKLSATDLASNLSERWGDLYEISVLENPPKPKKGKNQEGAASKGKGKKRSLEEAERSSETEVPEGTLSKRAKTSSEEKPAGAKDTVVEPDAWRHAILQHVPVSEYSQKLDQHYRGLEMASHLDLAKSEGREIHQISQAILQKVHGALETVDVAKTEEKDASDDDNSSYNPFSEERGDWAEGDDSGLIPEDAEYGEVSPDEDD